MLLPARPARHRHRIVDEQQEKLLGPDGALHPAEYTITELALVETTNDDPTKWQVRPVPFTDYHSSAFPAPHTTSCAPPCEQFIAAFLVLTSFEGRNKLSIGHERCLSGISQPRC